MSVHVDRSKPRQGFGQVVLLAHQWGFRFLIAWAANAVACGIVSISRRSLWLNRTALQQLCHGTSENPTAAYLLPFLAILFAGTLAHATLESP
jgi:hypothetical protein